jgi:hypothetical protein
MTLSAFKGKVMNAHVVTLILANLINCLTLFVSLLLQQQRHFAFIISLLQRCKCLEFLCLSDMIEAWLVFIGSLLISLTLIFDQISPHCI